MSTKSPIEIYIHIPFCVKKCAYCDFLSGPQSKKVIENYVQALQKEIKVYKQFATKYIVTSVFVGGGTPSILEAPQMEVIFETLKAEFEFGEALEITVEINPGTVTLGKLETYRACGVNRISLGLQSANDDELKLLGRIHNYQDFVESYQMVRQCGFDNVNIDLISAIPNQTLENLEETLKKVIGLGPEHISVYSLIIEEGTPFAKLYGEGCPCEDMLPDEDVERRMYGRTEEILYEAGYHRYEISNYAVKGKECKHNIGYWERKDYLGIGLGAASLVGNCRFSNTQDMDKYLMHSGHTEKIRCHEEILTQKEQMEEYFFLGLRKMQGVSLKGFENAFGETMQNYYGDKIAELKSEQLLEEIDGYLRLTKRGIDISNYVFTELLRD